MLKRLLAGKPFAKCAREEKKQAEYKFILGKMQYDGTFIPFMESTRHRIGNKILLFLNEDKLLEYLEKKQANANHFKRERSKGLDEIYIAETMPYPNLFHIAVYACAENDEGKINQLIEERKRQILNNHGILPEKTFIPYVNARNDFVPVLEVSFE